MGGSIPAHQDPTTLVFSDEIVCRYGVSELITVTKGHFFVSGLIQSLCDQLGIKHTQATAYHPQGNGRVERFNPICWLKLSQTFALAEKSICIPDSNHESMEYTLFLATFGRAPNLPVDVILRSRQAENRLFLFTEVRKRVKAAHAKLKQLPDKRACGQRFHVGNRMWHFVPIVKCGQTKKFVSLWRGPYTIIDKVSAVIELQNRLVCNNNHF